jgi:glycosyltransferase involved in cell wall biosynthesis
MVSRSGHWQPEGGAKGAQKAFGMPELPLVSVITPTYNRESFLPETIKSVLNQDYPNLEYLVLDDGSQDGTVDLLLSYEDRLAWYHHENMGESRTVNRGFSLARGVFICVLSSDDVLLPEAITAAVKAFAEYPQAVVVYSDWAAIDENGLILSLSRHPDYSLTEMVLWHECPFGPGTMFRRSVVERLGGRDPDIRFVADFDFWLRAALLGPFIHLRRFDSCFRQHATSTTHSAQGLAMAGEHIDLVRKLYTLDLPDELKEIRGDAFSSAYFVAGCVTGPNFRARLRYFGRMLACSSWAFLRRQSWRIPSVIVLALESLPGVARFRHLVLDSKRQSLWKGRHYSLLPQVLPD